MDCRLEDFKSKIKNISFIVFNYDRCLEHFLVHATAAYFKINEEEAAEIIECVDIMHPYGVVGSYPFPSCRSPVQFGDELKGSNVHKIHNPLLQVSRKLRTFTEQIEDEHTLPSIKSAFTKAKNIVFLGFAYSDLNMKLLQTDEDKSYDETQVIGSAYGFSDDSVSNIASDIRQTFKLSLRHDVTVSQLTCSELFDEYSRKLEAAIRF